MKTTLFFSSFLLLLSTGLRPQAPSENREKAPFLAVPENKKPDTVLNHIQEKIAKAANEAFARGNTAGLDRIENELKKASVANENLRNYWIGYVNYNKTLAGLKAKNEDICKKANKNGVKALEANSVKTSEDYALLALLKGLSFSFSSVMRAPIISRQINGYVKKGLAADSTNFRVHYAQANVDFHTPKQFGGGKKTEKHLLKAVKLSEKNTGNPQLPTWGKEEVYDLLIRYYLREKQQDKARKYFDEGKRKFPDSRVLSAHQRNFPE